MAATDDVKQLCERLAPHGWGTLLLRHGLDLTAFNIEAELARELVSIDRTQAGFEDFCASGVRGVEPGDPAMSLLYHALASPDVHPNPGSGSDPVPPEHYPTLGELDALENYIYGLKPLDPALLNDVVVGVFAYQYRPAASSAHRTHADFVFSRTGVARVGTTDPVWEPKWRCFRPDPLEAADIAVTPARYAAFVARPIRPTAADPVLGQRDREDRLNTFHYPFHKVFPGDACIRGLMLGLEFLEYHRNEKLRRVHEPGGVAVVPGFDIDALPFVRDSTNGGGLVEAVPVGASVLIVPRPHARLVRTVQQRNEVSGHDEIVRFEVPPERIPPGSNRSNRFSTTLEITAVGDVRQAPEYVNIRHRVRREGGGGLVVEDLRSLPDEVFFRTIQRGGYEAAHFTDDTCDGAVVAKVTGLATSSRTLPAYSLVSAPDFFPLADQFEISDWVRRTVMTSDAHFAQGAPWPLCEGRWPANLRLPRPGALGDLAFEPNDKTVAAVVGARPRGPVTHLPKRRKRFASFLPDAASNVFAPGWDASLTTDGTNRFLAAYGLGSPFPEDAKLCAALNSFWPAVAPDASRTFRVTNSPTATPLLDVELGLHPRHPRAVSGGGATTGWDGEQGPFFEQDAGGERFVNAASLARSDYVTNSLQGRMVVRLTAGLDADELIRRMDALRRSIAALPPGDDSVVETPLWLVSADAVPDWAEVSDRGESTLEGPGYAFSFALVGDGAPDPTDLARTRFPLTARLDCQVSEDLVLWRRDGEGWQQPLSS
jgi:hypothetical protein